jgi:hypothetical protein
VPFTFNLYRYGEAPRSTALRKLAIIPSPGGGGGRRFALSRKLLPAPPTDTLEREVSEEDWLRGTFVTNNFEVELYES